MKVVILAGGFGTRISEFSNLIPKPMIKVGGKPILARIIEKLIQEGFENIIISLGYLSEVIENFINKNNYQANIIFVYEDKPLGTAGALASIDRKNRQINLSIFALEKSEEKEILKENISKNKKIESETKTSIGDLIQEEISDSSKE